jgi:hypothetical protein
MNHPKRCGASLPTALQRAAKVWPERSGALCGGSVTNSRFVAPATRQR